MANETVPVTARKIGPSEGLLTRPKVFYLTQEDIKKIERFTGGCAIFLKYARGKKVELYESPLDVQTALAVGATTNPYTAGNQDLAVSAAASVLTGATVLSKYLNKVTAATADTANSLRLPAPSNRNVCVIINGTSVPLKVFPHGASAYVDNGASGASKAIPGFGRMHFATPAITTAGASAVWKSAKDTNVA
jgi:hypothetical protein